MERSWLPIRIALAVGSTVALVGAAVGVNGAHAATTALVQSEKKPAVGSKAAPVKIGRYANIGSGWRMRVLSITWEADATQLGFGTTPTGAEDVVVEIEVKYLRGGSGNSQSVTNQVNALGSHGAAYKNGLVCGGNIQFGDGGVSVFSQQVAKGNVCFQIAKNDAATLRLFVYRVGTLLYPPKNAPRVWFALR